MLSSYLKIAIKVLMRRKFFTFISLFGIAFTLSVLMITTAVIDHLFGTHAPEVHRPRTLALYRMQMTGPVGTSSGSAGYGFLDRYARDLPGVEAVSFIGNQQTVISWVDGRKIESVLKRSDGAFWRIFEFEFVEGG